MRRAMLTAIVAISLSGMGGSAALAQPTRAAAARPPGDTARDTLRHPAEIGACAGVKPGDTVSELIPGGGYYTRLLSAAVGPSGKVFAVVPTAIVKIKPEAVRSERALAAEPGYGNVTVVVEGLGKITDQAPADVIWTTQNYHDLYNDHVPPDTAVIVDKAVFAALKPGGVYLVEDHTGAPGTGASQASTLHRIESKAVANPADPHTMVVFDPSIRGRTDQFVFRFRKPT